MGSRGEGFPQSVSTEEQGAPSAVSSKDFTPATAAGLLHNNLNRPKTL